MTESLISMKKGIVTKIVNSEEQRTDIIVNVDGKLEEAINYNLLTGKVSEFDTVILNTTAVEYKLGTGGYHFVIYNTKREKMDAIKVGHIMKLRYTPFQVKIESTEEQASQHHQVFTNFVSLRGFPVIVGTLHSMLSPITAILKYLNPNVKIAYIMTDGASLPLAFSDTVLVLRKKKLLEATITIGHAFGGDLECINIYNGLIAAKEITKADIAVVTMGPGIVGTGTPYGFSSIEQGTIINAVTDLGGTSIAVPRISFADKRERHYGISHHSLTVLNKIVKCRTTVIIPKLDCYKKKS